MPRANKRLRQLGPVAREGRTETRSLQRHKKGVQQYVQDLEDLTAGFKESKGKNRTFEENKMFLRIILCEF